VVALLVVCWPVSWDVVLAVDIGARDLHEGWIGARPHILVAARAWEIPLAGDAFWALGSPISRWGDYGAVGHPERESGGEYPGRTAGFYGQSDGSHEGYPVSRLKKKEEKNF
jgi:hypothetical protein